MKHSILIVLFFFTVYTVKAQKATISGTLEDAKTGEQLIGASVYDALTNKGTTTNYYGLYSLTLPKGKVKFSVSYMGYKSIILDLFLSHDTSINLKLEPVVSELKEVVVTGDARKNVRSSQMGLVEIPMAQTKQLPVLLGEADIIKTIQLMPGVKGGTEGSSGLFVRGGGADQNLILLDKVPVYNANHVMGFFSVFNSDAIQSFQMYKGGFPARYGGRLSSVIDIKMKEGNNKEYHGEATVGLIASKFTFEGPIIKDKCSFIISARRTYIDMLMKPIMKAKSPDNIIGLYFYDINAKVNYKLSDKSTIYYSVYSGLDKLSMDNKNRYNQDSIKTSTNLKLAIGWGNLTNALRWNYMINDKLFINTTFTYSKYELFNNIGMQFNDETAHVKDNFKLEYNSGIKDLGAKVDFDFIPNSNHYIRFGGTFTNHRFTPGVNAMKYNRQNGSENEAAKIDTTMGKKDLRFDEIDAYVEDDISITEKLKFNLGVHYSGSSVKDKYYQSFQPRISGRYMFTENFSVKASYVQSEQYIHLLTNSSISLPTDLWVPATEKVKPQKAWQGALGVTYMIKTGLELSVEGYYKEMSNLIEYKEGASYMSNSGDWQDKVTSGNGTAVGLEVMLSKTTGNTTGWIAYTLSKAERKFSNISFGEAFPYRYDRRHDVSIAATHKFNEMYDCGATWVFGTGLPFTLPLEKYASIISQTDPASETFQTNDIAYIQKRNGFRMPSYHRLDFSVNRTKKVRFGTTKWSVGAYNVYNKANPFFVDVEDKKGNSGGKVLKQYSMFPIVPYVSFSFKF